MADFSINKVQAIGDVQRTFAWQLYLKLPSVVNTAIGSAKGSADPVDALSLRCRSVGIPGRSVDIITSNYMGMEQFFPGRLHYTNPFNITFEEFEDRTIAKMLYAWQQMVFNATNGVGHGRDKKDYVALACQLKLFKYNGDQIAETESGVIQINNAWPESVAEVPLSYAESNALQYTLALRYDTWEYIKVVIPAM